MKNRQISESIEVGIFLALSGGFMDAYSYINRGKVFANAETGNIILMALKVCEGKFFEAVNYLIPIVSFAVGVAICEIIKYRKERINMIHWRQILVLFEIFAFIVVGFLPQEMNRVANSIISMISGIQFATFPKIRGTAMATTMCTGNLKTGTQNMYRGIKNGDKSAIEKGLYSEGMPNYLVKMAVGRPREVQSAVFQGATTERWHYKTLTLTFQNGRLIGWESVDNSTPKAGI